MEREQELFERTVRAMEAEIANAGAHLAIDSSARQTYHRQIRLMADQLRQQVRSGALTWAQAAAEAQQTRNLIMDLIRARSTPVGLAVAQRIKREGRTLNEVIARKVIRIHGTGATFSRLSPAQQSRIYAEIVKAAGTSRPEITAAMRRISHAARGLLAVSVALSVYTVMTSENKARASAREAALSGSGIVGGFAGGALAGIACGPGAPVCVGVGAFVGGALAAFGTSFAW